MERAYETREATHGNAYGAFAKIVKGDDGTLDTTTAPQIFTGLRGVSFETTQEATDYYADNVVHVSLKGNKTIEGSIMAYQIPLQFFLDHLGYKQTTAGGITDTGTAENFIWQYVETVTDEFGVETEQLTIYYNVQASDPTAESVTDEDTAEPKEFEIPCTAKANSLVLDSDGKPCGKYTIKRTETNGALIDLAYTQIILPTTAVPATTPEA